MTESHSCRALYRGALLALAAATTAIPGNAVADKYCVSEVPIEVSNRRAYDEKVCDLGTGAKVRLGLRYLQASPGSERPLLYDRCTYEWPDGRIEEKSLYWGFSKDRKIIGPYDIGYLVPFKGASQIESVGGLLIGSEVTGKSVDAKRWGATDIKHRLFRQDEDGVPQLAGAEILPYPFPPTDTFPSTDLPRLGVRAEIKDNQLIISDADGVEENVGKLNYGDDYRGWEGIYELGDGRIYVEGVQYDHAVRIEKVAGDWKATEILRIRPGGDDHNSLLGRWLNIEGEQNKRDRLSKNIRSGRCKAYSKALRTMFFCDEMQELKGSELRPIGDGTRPLKRFIGDLEHLSLAVFLGEDGQLYSYDGDELRPVEGAKIDKGLITALPSLKRALLATPNQLFEFRGSAGALELVPLEVGPADDFFFTRFHVAPNGSDIIALTRAGVELLNGNRFDRIWSAPEGARVQVTGNADPIPMPAWSGILFATFELKNSKQNYWPPRIQLLTTCAPNSGAGSAN